MIAAQGSEDEPTESGAENLGAADAAVRRALVEGHNDLLAFLQRRLGSREEAEEVLQRFSVRALEHASDLRDVHTVRGWLGRVLATTIVDHQRRAIRHRRREVAMDPEALDLASRAITSDREADQIVCDCLYKLLPTLKPTYSEVLWRVDLLGEPRDRVAASLGATLNNITVRLHRGRRELRMRLEEMCLTCPVHGFFDCRCDEAERIRRMHEAARQKRMASEDSSSMSERKPPQRQSQRRRAR